MKMSDTKQEFHIPVADDILALDLLHRETGFSKQRIKEIMQKGAVWVTEGKRTQRIRRAKKSVFSGTTLHLYYDPDVLAKEPAGAHLVSDEEAYSIWYKPYGMYSQGTKWGDHCTVYRWAESHLVPQRPVYIVHRLDRAATGLIIIAHRKGMAAAFTEIFKNREIQKTYRVIVHGAYPDDTGCKTISTDIEGRRAVSHVTVLSADSGRNRSLLEIRIETGRKHQIRRHLSESGFPVVGDRLYGNKKDKEDLQLNAFFLSFNCPLEKKRKSFRLPDELTITSI